MADRSDATPADQLQHETDVFLYHLTSTRSIAPNDSNFDRIRPELVRQNSEPHITLSKFDR
jgi:hypothetical protein